MLDMYYQNIYWVYLTMKIDFVNELELSVACL
jgi:hypothetical protein